METRLDNNSKPINTALCSFGMSGKVFHAPFIKQHAGYHLYAVWERSKQQAHEHYPGIRSYSTYAELLADPAIELVVVNTPNITHFEYTKLALEAGRHVIVEKPFTVTAEEASILISLAERNNLKLSVYHNRRYDSDFKIIKKILSEGVLGPIVEAEFHFDRYKEDISPKQHKEIPVPGTGALYDLGSHLTDQALQLFGWPVAVFADIAAMRPVSKVDDYFEVLLYYPGNRVRLKASYQVREALPGYILHGAKGSFIKARTDVQEAALVAGKQPGGPDWGKEPDTEKGLLHTIIDGKVIREYIPSLRGDYSEYYAAMHGAIRQGTPVPVSAAEARQVIQVIEAAFRSSTEKRVVPL